MSLLEGIAFRPIVEILFLVANGEGDVITKIKILCFGRVFEGDASHEMEITKSVEGRETRSSRGPSFFEFGGFVWTDAEAIVGDVTVVGEEEGGRGGGLS